MSDNFVKVWQFGDAPQEYRDLSTHGGDEDYVAFVPDALRDYWFMFLDEGTPFGCCCVSEHKVKGGKVLIGAHS